MFERKAVLIERCDVLTRDRDFWKNRSLELEGKLDAERERNRSREDYLLNLTLVKRAEVAPIPTAEAVPIPEPENTSLIDFKNTIFADWAKEQGVTPYEANMYWELHKDSYANELSE